MTTVKVKDGRMAPDFEQLLRETHLEIRVYVARLGVPEKDVDDVAQETYLEYYRNAHKKPRDAAPRQWLKGIARNLSNSYFRKWGRRRNLFAEHVAGVLGAEQEAWAGTRAGEDALDALERCLESLPERNREIVALHYREELGSAEIGKRCDMHQGAVRKTLSKVRRTLKTCMEQALGIARPH